MGKLQEKVIAAYTGTAPSISVLFSNYSNSTSFYWGDATRLKIGIKTSTDDDSEDDTCFAAVYFTGTKKVTNATTAYNSKGSYSWSDVSAFDDMSYNARNTFTIALSTLGITTCPNITTTYYFTIAFRKRRYEYTNTSDVQVVSFTILMPKANSPTLFSLSIIGCTDTHSFCSNLEYTTNKKLWCGLKRLILLYWSPVTEYPLKYLSSTLYPITSYVILRRTYSADSQTWGLWAAISEVSATIDSENLNYKDDGYFHVNTTGPYHIGSMFEYRIYSKVENELSFNSDPLAIPQYTLGVYFYDFSSTSTRFQFNSDYGLQTNITQLNNQSLTLILNYDGETITDEIALNHNFDTSIFTQYDLLTISLLASDTFSIYDSNFVNIDRMPINSNYNFALTSNFILQNFPDIEFNQPIYLYNTAVIIDKTSDAITEYNNLLIRNTTYQTLQDDIFYYRTYSSNISHNNDIEIDLLGNQYIRIGSRQSFSISWPLSESIDNITPTYDVGLYIYGSDVPNLDLEQKIITDIDNAEDVFNSIGYKTFYDPAFTTLDTTYVIRITINYGLNNANNTYFDIPHIFLKIMSPIINTISYGSLANNTGFNITINNFYINFDYVPNTITKYSSSFTGLDGYWPKYKLYTSFYGQLTDGTNLHLLKTFENNSTHVYTIPEEDISKYYVQNLLIIITAISYYQSIITTGLNDVISIGQQLPNNAILYYIGLIKSSSIFTYQSSSVVTPINIQLILNSDGTITLKWEADSMPEDETFNIYCNGELIELNISGYNYTIDISNWNNGTYIFQIGGKYDGILSINQDIVKLHINKINNIHYFKNKWMACVMYRYNGTSWEKCKVHYRQNNSISNKWIRI